MCEAYESAFFIRYDSPFFFVFVFFWVLLCIFHTFYWLLDAMQQKYEVKNVGKETTCERKIRKVIL